MSNTPGSSIMLPVSGGKCLVALSDELILSGERWALIYRGEKGIGVATVYLRVTKAIGAARVMRLRRGIERETGLRVTCGPWTSLTRYAFRGTLRTALEVRVSISGEIQVDMMRAAGVQHNGDITFE